MREWDELSNYLLVDPDAVSENSTSEVWWKCPEKAHLYRMSIRRRVMFDYRGIRALSVKAEAEKRVTSTGEKSDFYRAKVREKNRPQQLLEPVFSCVGFVIKSLFGENPLKKFFTYTGILAQLLHLAGRTQ